MLCHNYYAELVVARFSHQNQSEYNGGDLSVSIECISLEYVSGTFQEKSSSYSHSHTRHALFHLFMSNNSKQDASTTASHSKRIIDMLKNINV